MTKRPQISDQLYEEIENIYRNVEGTEPSNFEEALRLLLGFADAELSDEEAESTGWYPGKYIGEGLDYLATRRLNRGQKSATGTSEQADRIDFKTILDEPDRIDVPPAEVMANDLQSGDLMTVRLERLNREE